MNKNWKEITGDRFSIKSENIFTEGSRHIPVVVFQHLKTGEIKLFSRAWVEKVGMDNLQFYS